LIPIPFPCMTWQNPLFYALPHIALIGIFYPIALILVLNLNELLQPSQAFNKLNNNHYHLDLHYAFLSL